MKVAKYAVMIPVCPKCDARLLLSRFKSVEVDYCDNCRGVWLDAGELEQLAGGPLPDFQHETGTVPPGKKHLCPRCDARLEEITAPGNLKLDKCPRGHGLWFDADELQQLLATAHGAQLTEHFNLGGN
jgi:Zn-finger nucleic acid-binding protein